MNKNYRFSGGIIGY